MRYRVDASARSLPRQEIPKVSCYASRLRSNLLEKTDFVKAQKTEKGLPEKLLFLREIETCVKTSKGVTLDDFIHINRPIDFFTYTEAI